jgi:hypothetical protein
MANPIGAGVEGAAIKGTEYASYGFKMAKAAILGEKAVMTLKYSATSGAQLVATAGKTTTILGRYVDDIQYIIKELELPNSMDFGPKSNNFNILNVPDDLYVTAEQFWNDINKPFLDQAIARGDEIIMATPASLDKLFYAGTNELTGYGREYYYLLENGYEFVSELSKMIKN